MKGRFKGLSFIPINIEQDRDLLFAFKLDTHLMSHGSPEGYNPDHYFERLKHRLDIYPEGQLFLVSGKQIIGQIGYFPEKHEDGQWGYIHMLYVIPQARGQGLGKYLLGKAIDHFREMGITTVALRVSTLNQSAMKLYKSMGFVEVAHEDSSKSPMVLQVRKKE